MTTAAAYCRISKDDEGLALGVERQREDCLALADHLGLTVAPEHVLIENDVGASTRSRAARPEYEKLKTLVSDRVVTAVVFYSNSRLTRRPKELEEWIALHERTGVRLHSKVSGDDNLSTADGRMVARIKASVDAAEAERIGERVRRSFEQRRQSGLLSTGGPRPFGFDSSTGAPSLVADEAAAIRHGAAMLIAGGTFGQVAKEWTARGLKPVRAASWTRESVRSVYRSARVAGLVAYDGTVVATGTFEPILDRATWEAVNEAVVHAPARPAGYGARVNVLAGFVFCGICGATMVVSGAEGTVGASYRCVRQRQGCGGVRRNKRWLDELVDGWLRRRLEQSGDIEVEAKASDTDDEVHRLEHQIADLRQKNINGEIDGEDFFPLLSGLRSKLNEARKRRVGELRAETQSAALLDPVGEWESGTLVARRALVAAHVQGIYVKPVGRIGRMYPPVSSVEIVPAT